MIPQPQPNSVAENAWFCGENFEFFEKLFQEIPTYITQENEIYMILSEDCELEKIQMIALHNKITFDLITKKKIALECNFIFLLKKL